MPTIQPPFGYRALKPLNRNDHVRLLAAGEMPPFARESQIVPLSYSEITVAAWHYPVIFVPDETTGGHTMAALVGLDRKRNAFRREIDGEKSGWDSEAYVPAYLRRYPFCMATVTIGNQTDRDLMVCVESAHTRNDPVDGAIRLFDAEGKPLPQWGAIEAFLKEYEADLQGSRAFVAELNELGLLEPFTANVVRPDGTQQSLAGLVRVDEAKLSALDMETVARLHRNGYLGRIYIHLFSLQRFRDLLSREGRQAAMPQPAPVVQGADSIAVAAG
ncbi:MAG: SapC family protein [Moraxellaceae bacterium]|nr:SapC family protein [Moraxellaceae bacterium]